MTRRDARDSLVLLWLVLLTGTVLLLPIVVLLLRMKGKM
jgi:hypothetical protein